ncbi:MAG: two pore domain potassium channel family protein [Euryarchaeota archaeon]|nr:two pore domain potassium channel family protein [Euryarchaeota archaeon]
MDVDVPETDLITFKTFFGIFLKVIYVLRKIVTTMVAFIFIMGIFLAFIEKLSLGDGIYLAFVSAFTVGYGDIVPHTLLGRVVCVIILPITGMLLTGIIVAAAIAAIDRGLKMGKNN